MGFKSSEFDGELLFEIAQTNYISQYQFLSGTGLLQVHQPLYHS